MNYIFTEQHEFNQAYVEFDMSIRTNENVIWQWDVEVWNKVISMEVVNVMI